LYSAFASSTTANSSLPFFSDGFAVFQPFFAEAVGFLFMAVFATIEFLRNAGQTPRSNA